MSITSPFTVYMIYIVWLLVFRFIVKSDPTHKCTIFTLLTSKVSGGIWGGFRYIMSLQNLPSHTNMDVWPLWLKLSQWYIVPASHMYIGNIYVILPCGTCVPVPMAAVSIPFQPSPSRGVIWWNQCIQHTIRVEEVWEIGAMV